MKPSCLPDHHSAPAVTGALFDAPLGRLSMLPEEILVDRILIPLANQDLRFLPGFHQTCTTAYRQTCDLAERITASEVVRMRRNNPILMTPGDAPLMTPTFNAGLVRRAQSFIHRVTPRPPLEQAQRFEAYFDTLLSQQREHHSARRVALWAAAAAHDPTSMAAWEGYFHCLTQPARTIAAFERLAQVQLPKDVVIAPAIFTRVASAYWNNQNAMLQLQKITPTLRVLVQGRQTHPNEIALSSALLTYFTLALQWAQSYHHHEIQEHSIEYVEFLLVLDAVADEIAYSRATVDQLITRFCERFELFQRPILETDEENPEGPQRPSQLRIALHQYLARPEDST